MFISVSQSSLFTISLLFRKQSKILRLRVCSLSLDHDETSATVTHLFLQKGSQVCLLDLMESSFLKEVEQIKGQVK